MKFFSIITLILSLCYSSWSQNDKLYNIEIIDKPINYNAARINLSLEYLKNRHGIIQKEPTIIPKMIVLHYTGGGTLNSNFNYFNNVEIENSRSLNKDQSKLNVSAHFLIDKDGKIYRLMPETMFARHTIGLNYCAIGVENIAKNEQSLTPAQVKANIELVKYLCSRFDIEYLIGHSEYLAFRNTPLWKETNPKYITYKSDPGDKFMSQVRKGLNGYSLKSKP